METGTRERRRLLLELDEGLGATLDPARRDRARRELAVHVVGIPPGEWTPVRPAVDDRGGTGLLVVDGVLASETLLRDAGTTELLGPGDVLHPWQDDADERLLPSRVRWEALAPTRCAVLDSRLTAAASRYPEVGTLLLARAEARTRRLATVHAIAQVKFVHKRVLALLWHLAERWGRVVPGGVLVPLVLSHRLLADLIGSRRPTVSTAVKQLADAGELARRPDGTWLLQGRPEVGDVDRGPLARRHHRFGPAPDESVLELEPREPLRAVASVAVNIRQDAQLAAYRESVERLRAVGAVEGERLATLSAQMRRLLETQAALRGERLASG